MSTRVELGTLALQLLGVIDPTEAPSAEDSGLATSVLNMWMDALGVQRQTIFHLTRTTKALVSGTASYTLGTGGTFSATLVRPLWIQDAGFVLDTSVSYPIEIPIRVFTDDEWAALTPKTLASSVVEGVYCDFNWVAGLATLSIWPIPNVSNTQLVLYTPTALTEFADDTTDYTFPPGYKRAILYNLANELAPWYPTAKPDPRIAKIAESSMALIKRGNWRPSVVSIDPAVSRTSTNRRATVTASQFAAGKF